MPLIQIIADGHKFVTVGYDRVIAHWEVLPGGNYVEHLGCLHTLGSTITHLQVTNQSLFIPQPHKLLVMDIDTQISFDCQLPQGQLLGLKACQFNDGLLMLRYQSRIVLYMTHTRETVYVFKTTAADCVFQADQVKMDTKGVSKETITLITNQFQIVTLHVSEHGWQIYHQLPRPKLIMQGKQQVSQLYQSLVASQTLVVLLPSMQEIKGKFMCQQSDQVVLVQQDQRLVMFKQGKEQSSFKIKPQFACIVPNKQMCCVILKDGLKLLDIAGRSISILAQCKYSYVYKPTAIIATSTQVVIATEDKRVSVKPFTEFVHDQLQHKRQKVQTDTIFGIVRSRVFYQQKLVDIQQVTQMLIDRESDDKIDFKLLRWTETNPLDVEDVINMEIASCIKVERFEFYQKMCVLQEWLRIINKLPRGATTFDSHNDQFPGIFTDQFQQFIDGSLQTSDNIHLAVLLLLSAQKYQAASQVYIDNQCLTESLCVCKAFDLKHQFKQALEKALLAFKEAKDRQALAKKIEAALMQL